MSYIQSQMHSEYDSAESIADSDLEDGELRKMLASPLYIQSREDCESSRMVGQQRHQIAELQFDKIHSPKSFLVWRIRFKIQVTTCSDFPSEAMLWIKEVVMERN